MTASLMPLGNRLLVRLKPIEQKSLIINPYQREYARAAEVLRIGPEVRDIVVGMVVSVPAAAGQQVGDNVLVPESSVLAILEEAV